MDMNDFDAVREELEGRLQAMTGLFDPYAFQNELHALGDIARCYGLTGFAEAAHMVEDRVMHGAKPKKLGPHLAALGRELEFAVPG
ncbi:hypothetical protein KCG44_02865 [Pacificimonas sp. WHA3]|uniref:HPt domain-containing protein n=1 Tax=Pacificimonas pallii TaxID=2827236 RepID=A0ABS6SC94_9SPHN|nr:hypothetical protein [Pacificimonas pallii]MBV7255723.1 hypothetical protein [Pacificimonas pallii]